MYVTAMTDQNELNECPKCKAKSATTEIRGDGSSRFFCTLERCDFEIVQEKQNMDKARGKLSDIKSKLFGDQG